MSYSKEIGHKNVESTAAIVHHDIETARPDGNMEGENQMDVDISETPSNSFEKDTSIVRRANTDLKLKIAISASRGSQSSKLGCEAPSS